jgi:hypothetical protein
LHKKLITALLASLTAGAASAQVASSSDGKTQALLSDAAPIEVAALDAGSSGGHTTALLSYAAPVEFAALHGCVTNMCQPCPMALEEHCSFADPAAIQLEGHELLQTFDLLRGNAHDSSVHFGRDKDVQFVENHPNRPGIATPVGLSYPMRQHRWEFFAEVAPILDPAPNTSMGWGGGLGFRFFIGH